MLLHFFWNLIAFIISLGILIIVHEYGHFIAARFFKVKIERFSIGFGPVLWNKKGLDGTEYVISAILLGGYVKLFDMQTESTYSHHDHKDYNNSFCGIRIWQRSIIAAAGPILNFAFSILSYILVFIIGMPVYKPIINYVLPNSIIEQSKISPGSEIKYINNIPVYNWESVRCQIANSINYGKRDINLSIISADQSSLEIHVLHIFDNCLKSSIIDTTDPVIALGMFPNILYVIASNESYMGCNSCNSGISSLKVNDKILLIDKQLIYSWSSFERYIQQNPKRIFKITVERDKEILDVNFLVTEDIVDFNKTKKNFNFLKNVVILKNTEPKIYRCGLYTAILQAFYKTWNLICLTINALFQLIFGDFKTINLNGPISIAQVAGQSARSGVIYYFIFLAMLSVNLGVVNLLPLPILDGGLLFFLLLEKLKGSPISKNIQNFGYIIGFIILTLLMCLAFYNDISKLLS